MITRKYKCGYSRVSQVSLCSVSFRLCHEPKVKEETQCLPQFRERERERERERCLGPFETIAFDAPDDNQKSFGGLHSGNQKKKRRSMQKRSRGFHDFIGGSAQKQFVPK